MPNKTAPTCVPVTDFIAAVPDPRRRGEALRLDAIFREVTGFRPVLWGPSMVGYGRYHYRYASGREGDALATGFSPRKAAISIYIMPGYADFGPILEDLGKHRRGRACLYLNRLDDVDEGALRRLIRAGLEDLARHWPVLPS
jgi:hypothetical protein